MPELLLCTDMDRTIIPNGPQSEHPDARPRFRALCARPEVSLVYVSGRDKALVEQAMHEYELPLPNFVISDVGTRIYHCDGAQWQELDEWQRQIARDWQGRSYQQIHALMRDIDPLQLQEASRQNTCKLSYYLALDTDHEAVIGQMRQRLAAADIRANLIWSIDELAGTGLLDVLPGSASKLHAIQFLHNIIATRNTKVIFAGDSGNDFEVLVSGIDAVLVNNASSELKHLVSRTVTASGNEKHLLIAHGDCRLGMNGNYAAGVLQGVAHFAPGFLII